MKIITRNSRRAFGSHLDSEAAQALGIGRFGNSMELYHAPRAKDQNTNSEKEMTKMNKHDQSLAATITEIGEIAAQRIKEMQYQIDDMGKVIGRIGAPPGGGPSRESTSAQREHATAFEGFLRKGGDPEAVNALAFRAGLNTQSDPDGGALVSVEMDKEIGRILVEGVPMRRLADVITRRGEYKKPMSRGGADGGWVGEQESRGETANAELAMFSPAWCELYANPKVSQKLLDTSDFDVAGWMIDEVTDVFLAKEGAGFITGDGCGKVRGIASYEMVPNSSWEFGKVGYIAGGHASLLNNADCIIDLQHALKSQYRINGVWLMNDATWAVIRKLKDGEGNYLWAPGLMESAPDRLLGKPVEICDDMPNIGAGEYPIAFGDWKAAYKIVDHVSSVRVLRDPYSEKGQVFYYTTKRVAAGVCNHAALKFLKISV